MDALHESNRPLFCSPVAPAKTKKARGKKKNDVPVRERLELSKENASTEAPALHSELTAKLEAADQRRAAALQARITPRKTPKKPEEESSAEKAAALAAKLEAANVRRVEALESRSTPRKQYFSPVVDTSASKAAALEAKLDAATQSANLAQPTR